MVAGNNTNRFLPIQNTTNHSALKFEFTLSGKMNQFAFKVVEYIQAADDTYPIIYESGIAICI